MELTASTLPEDVARDLAELGAAIRAGEAEERKDRGKPRTVHGPRGLRWFPQATERGLTLRSFLISTGVGASFLGVVLTGLAFGNDAPQRFVALGVTIVLALLTTALVVTESRRGSRARAEVALGTFLLGDALVVVDRGRYWVVRRQDIRRVGDLRGYQRGDAGYVRFLAVEHETPDGPKWLRIGWRDHPGARELIETWVRGDAVAREEPPQSTSVG